MHVKISSTQLPIPNLLPKQTNVIKVMLPVLSKNISSVYIYTYYLYYRNMPVVLLNVYFQ